MAKKNTMTTAQLRDAHEDAEARARLAEAEQATIDHATFNGRTLKQEVQQRIAAMADLCLILKTNAVTLADRLSDFWYTNDRAADFRTESGYKKIADMAAGWGLTKGNAIDLTRLGVVRFVLKGAGLESDITSTKAAKTIVSGLTYEDDKGDTKDCNMRGQTCDYIDAGRNAGLLTRLAFYSMLRAEGLGEIVAAEKATKFEKAGYTEDAFDQARAEEAEFESDTPANPKRSGLESIDDAHKRLATALDKALEEGEAAAVLDRIGSIRDLLTKAAKAAKAAG